MNYPYPKHSRLAQACIVTLLALAMFSTLMLASGSSKIAQSEQIIEEKAEPEMSSTSIELVSAQNTIVQLQSELEQKTLELKLKEEEAQEKEQQVESLELSRYFITADRCLRK
jgi:uncharacterized membrane protein YhiD involved in acid resistance